MFSNSLEALGDELIYIGGNHDPITMFSENPPVLSSNVEGNIHRGSYKLRDDLVIIGLGGCVQDYV
jgi:hypothetical protein